MDKYEIYRMKGDTYVQNGDEVYVKRYGDNKFFHGKIENRGNDFSSNPSMHIRMDSGSVWCVKKTECFFPDKALEEMIKEDSKSLDELLSSDQIDTTTEDFVRGKVIKVPDYEQWCQTHKDSYSGHYDYSSKISENFKAIREELWMFGLPVTDCFVRGNGELELCYYHHTEDNVYYLGEIKGKTLEEFEKMTPNEFKKYILDQIQKQEQIVGGEAK